MNILQFLYNFYNSQYFGILLLIWTTVDIAWVNRWQALLRRIRKITLKPWIFSSDPELSEPSSDENDRLFYPRQFLEQLALRRTYLDSQANDNFLSRQQKVLFNPEHPQRTVSYITFFAFFLLFLLADAIAVSQTLGLLGLDANFLPAWLNRIEISLLGGAVFAAVVGIWVLIEVSGDPTKPNANLPFNDYSQAQRNIIRGLSIIIFLLSVIISIALAVQRLISIDALQSNSTLDFILSFILFGLITINVFIAAAISFTFAQQGFVVLLYITAYIVIGILPILVFFLDVFWRIAHVAIDFLIWFLFTPFLAIPAFIKYVISILSPRTG